MKVALDQKLGSAFETYLLADARLVREVRLLVESRRELLYDRDRDDGLALVRDLTDMTDAVLRAYHRAAPAGRGLALLALGGYGRGELSPHSDVDVLVLYPEGVAGRASEFAGSLVAFLWDLGFTVAHSTRSPAECREAMSGDLPTATALLEGRLVEGSRTLYRRFVEEVAEPWLRERADEFVERKIQEVHARHRFYGGSPLLSVPNVKESAGGLRDLHVAGWVALALSGRKDLQVFREAGLLSEESHASLRSARSDVHRVRNALHLISGRNHDVLDFEVRRAAADRLGFKDRDGFSAVERFMRHYYRAARTLHGFLRRVLRFHEGCPAEPERRILDEELCEVGGEVYPVAEGIAESPEGALRAMALVAERSLVPARELVDAITRAVARIDGVVRSDPATARRFLEILSGPFAAVGLRALDEAGFLQEYLPEYGRLSCLAWEDPAHQYTVDEHTLRAVESLDRLVREDVSLAEEMARVKRPDLLRLGILLHDVGKARGRDHVARGTELVPEVTARLGLTDEEARLVRFLVSKHLTMTGLIDRRMLPEAVKILSEEVPDRDRLRCLFLLTLADVAATGRGALSGWRKAQLTGLYREALARLAPSPTRPFLLRVLDTAGPDREEAARAHLEGMGPRYSTEVAPTRVALHLSLVQGLDRGPAVLTYLPAGAFGEVWVAARDVPGLFARIAGVLTVHDLDIRGGQAYTREDGVALDGFFVTREGEAPPEDEELWREVAADLCRVVDGELDLAERLERHRRCFRTEPPPGPPGPPSGARCSNRVSPRFTMVEVAARDRPALLHDLAAVIADHGLSIHHAVIATRGTGVIDRFYVSRPDGERPRGEELDELLAELSRLAVGEPA